MRGRAALNLGRWAHEKLVRGIVDALRDAPAEVLAATERAAHGAPVLDTDAFRQLAVLRAVRRILPRVRASTRPERNLEIALAACGVDEQAFDGLQLRPRDIEYVRNRRRRAFSVTAYLLLRAGACGVARRSEPTRKDVERVVRSLWQAENRAKKKKTLRAS